MKSIFSASMERYKTLLCFTVPLSIPGNLVRGSRWLCTQNIYMNFRPWLARHLNVNKRVSSDLLIFSQFHRLILKNLERLFPTIFIFESGKTGVGLEIKQTKNNNKKQQQKNNNKKNNNKKKKKKKKKKTHKKQTNKKSRKKKTH